MRKDCRQCYGTGRIDGEDCDNCNGTGIAGDFRLGLAILVIFLIVEICFILFLIE